MAKIIVLTNSPGALSLATMLAMRAAESRGDTVEVKTLTRAERNASPKEGQDDG